MKKIIIAGGTGFLGTVLINYFEEKAKTIIVFTRSKSYNDGIVQYVQWDAKNLGTWSTHIDGADVLINLTGKSVDCRYTKKNKTEILDSRIDATHILGLAIAKCKTPPKIWLNSSTATIYRHSLNKRMDEKTGEIGTGFSVEVAKAWEKTFFSYKLPKTRQVALRSSIVFGKNGGAFQPIKRLTQLGFGGKQGNGLQKISWIHEEDFARSLDFIIHDETIEGVINIVAPNPTTNEGLMKAIRQQLKVPFGIPMGKKLLDIGAIIINTETELILKSRNVVPQKLLDHNFKFKYATLTQSLVSLT